MGMYKAVICGSKDFLKKHQQHLNKPIVIGVYHYNLCLYTLYFAI